VSNSQRGDAARAENTPAAKAALEKGKRGPGQAIAITGLGCVGAPGRGLAQQRVALTSGQCGLARWDDSSLPLAAILPIGRVQCTLPRAPGRTLTLALTAAKEALAHAQLSRPARGDCGVILGSCTAGLPESERAFFTDQEAVDPHYQGQQTHRLTHALAQVLGCGGERSSHSVACASAANAIAEACEWLRQGIAPCVLVVGADALTRVTMAGFYGLMLVDAQGTRPFTEERHGMSLGEGAGALLLETVAHARQRGIAPVASLLGWGLSTDAYHATAPDPSGKYLDRCIAECLDDAGLASNDIDYVNAHGTGTIDNDRQEAAVLSARFGAIPTASSKRIYGHTLGACAAIEAVASCLAIQDACRWPSAGVEAATPFTNIRVVQQREATPLRAVLSTTLAFGGANAALCFGHAERAC